MGKEALRVLIDNIDEKEIDTVYRILVRFGEQTDPLPDELEAIIQTEGDYERGDYVSLDEAFA